MQSKLPLRRGIIEIALFILWVYLFVKAAGFVLQLTWGAIKIFAFALLMVLLPMLIIILLFAGGAMFLLPVGMLVLYLRWLM